jgi:hypothetical protein
MILQGVSQIELTRRPFLLLWLFDIKIHFCRRQLSIESARACIQLRRDAIDWPKSAMHPPRARPPLMFAKKD